MKKNINTEITPITKGVSKKELKEMLFKRPKKRIKSLFCFHDWIYWRFGSAQKQHRVCRKCYKKQQNADVLNTFNDWVREIHFK